VRKNIQRGLLSFFSLCWEECCNLATLIHIYLFIICVSPRIRTLILLLRYHRMSYVVIYSTQFLWPVDQTWTVQILLHRSSHLSNKHRYIMNHSINQHTHHIIPLSPSLLYNQQDSIGTFHIYHSQWLVVYISGIANYQFYIIYWKKQFSKKINLPHKPFNNDNPCFW
jgi:hypothetical protein